MGEKRVDFSELDWFKANLDRYAVEQLRLINGMYPDGQPRAGQRLKIIK